jgi:DNA-binding NtrC family response regulator
MTAEFCERLCLDPWPGNVRQLKSFALSLRAAIAADAPLTAAHFDACRPSTRNENDVADAPQARAPAERRASDVLESRRDQVLAVVAEDGNLAALARDLLVSKDSLYRFLNRTAPGWRARREQARRAGGAG